MKKLMLYAMLFLPCSLMAQIGVKAGINFANVTKASSINSSSQTGWHAGIVMGAPTQKLLGFRSELTYSKQGYDYQSGLNTGNVNLDYLMSSNLMTINITKLFQIQFGFQMAYLLSAKVDSTTNGGTGSQTPYDNIMDLYNRFDYGFAGGLEVNPISGLMLGARLNISLGKIYKDVQNGQAPSFSSEDLKNNVFQLYAGWRFGGKQQKKQKKQE